MHLHADPDQPEGNPPLDDEQSIIDRFLAVAPTLSRIRPPAEEEPLPAEALTPEPEAAPLQDPATAEALARALVAQGKRKEAASILLKLSVQMPDKSAYFADLLDNRASGPELF